MQFMIDCILEHCNTVAEVVQADHAAVANCPVRPPPFPPSPFYYIALIETSTIRALRSPPPLLMPTSRASVEAFQLPLVRFHLLMRKAIVESPVPSREV